MAMMMNDSIADNRNSGSNSPHLSSGLPPGLPPATRAAFLALQNSGNISQTGGGGGGVRRKMQDGSGDSAGSRAVVDELKLRSDRSRAGATEGLMDHNDEEGLDGLNRWEVLKPG